MPKSQRIRTFISEQIRVLRFIFTEGKVPKWLRVYAVFWVFWAFVCIPACLELMIENFIEGILVFHILVVMPYIPIYYWGKQHSILEKLSGKEAETTITRLDHLNDRGSGLEKARTSLEPQDSAHPQHHAELPKPTIEPPTAPEPSREPATVEPESGIQITSAFGYKGASIIHKVSVANPTEETVGDINLHLFVPEVFLLKDTEKHIGLLKPGESKTVTFGIRPTGECGDCEVSGRATYYDYASKKTKEVDIPTKSLSIVCPMLKAQKIDKSVWKDSVTRLIQAEESTTEIEIPAETLFTMISRVIEDMNMFMLEPEVTSTPQLFNGVARFSATGVKALNYAAQIEVVGGAKKSKLILKAWAEKEEALTGFYHGILDELDKRVHVKGYIDDSIVQQFYQVGTLVKDSVLQRSTIGAEDKAGKKCPRCGRTVSEDERYCPECGERLQ
jgi:hypothetical protein